MDNCDTLDLDTLHRQLRRQCRQDPAGCIRYALTLQGDAALQWLKARMLRRAGRKLQHDEALTVSIDTLRRLLQDQGPEPALQLELARALRTLARRQPDAQRQRLYAEAYHLYLRVAGAPDSDDDGRAYAYAQLGNLDRRRQHWPLALAHYRRALQLNRHLPAVQRGAGKLLHCVLPLRLPALAGSGWRHTPYAERPPHTDSHWQR